MSLAERLRTFVVLDGFSLQQLSALAMIGDERAAPAGHVIFREGEDAQELIFLLEGKVTLRSQGGGHLADAKAPSLLGEMGVLRRKPRLATATTTEPSVWLAVGAEEFHRLKGEDPELGRRFFENLSLVLMGQLERNNLLLEFLENIRK